ncbi:MAG: M24 family metallopeptidase, partial [Candidatus Marinimicrobia bacterium]|nr:M24 family metallopeptidase [Candidatus Neomarinimicrobiota bacterium]
MNNSNQVSHMTESCQILSDTLDMIESHVKPGQSVMELDKLAEEYILSRGAKTAFKGYNNFPYTLTISIDDEVVHGIPKDVVLEEGQIVGVDCKKKKNEYYGDSART